MYFSVLPRLPRQERRRLPFCHRLLALLHRRWFQVRVYSSAPYALCITRPPPLASSLFPLSPASLLGFVRITTPPSTPLRRSCTAYSSTGNGSRVQPICGCGPMALRCSTSPLAAAVGE
ncbi:hypothetical protein BS78_04G129100 [Paspalum vaginatum]|nr:hypothetical protein BS78_04G129100 [Paspalum vaginatum]